MKKLSTLFKKDQVVSLGDPSNDIENFHGSVKIELETQLTGQYLIHVERDVNGQGTIQGNRCLLVIIHGNLA